MPACIENNQNLHAEEDTSNRSEQTALLIQGGALRGLHTTGFLKVLHDEGLCFDCIMGISAGALNGISYLSDMLDRAILLHESYIMDPSFMGPRAVRESDVFSMINFDMMFDGVPGSVPRFDWTGYLQSSTRFLCGAVSARTGEIQYFEKGSGVNMRDACTASASLPFITRGREVDGELYYDGGIRDCIPLHRAQKDGYGKIILIMTREKGFRSEAPAPTMLRLTHMRFFTQGNFYGALIEQHHRYNTLLREVEALEDAGDPRYLVCRPSENTQLEFTDRSPEAVKHLVKLGMKDAEADLPRIREFLKS